MAVTLKDLGNGQLPAAKGTLYTVPGATNACARITVVNTDTVSRNVNIYVNRTGTSRRVSSKDQILGAGERAVFGPHTLEAADLVEGDATAATIVDYVIDGFEVT